MRVLINVWVLAGALTAASAAENLPAQVPSPKPGLTPLGSEDIAASQTLFPALTDPLQRDLMIQNLKQTQIPAFVHVGGGRSAAQDEQLRDSLALPKSRVANHPQKPPSAATRRRGPALKAASKKAPKGR